MSLMRRNRGTPEPNELDKFWNLVKAGLVTTGAVGAMSHPALGLFTIGAEAINQVQVYLAHRRSEEFVEEVADDLYEAHQNHRLTIEQIQQVISSEQFNSALLQARFIATRTHQGEKLEALRNAVFNVAFGSDFSDDQQGIFLALIDSLQPLHLQMLKLLEGEGTFHHKAPIVQVIAELQKQLPNLEKLGEGGTRSLLEDLARSNLIKIEMASSIARSVSAFHGRRTTEWGHKFLAFITTPGEKE